MQLVVKAYLLREVGDFPRVHSLADLLEAAGNPCLDKLSRDEWYVVDILDDAYTGSRYFIRWYGEREYRAAKRFAEEVFRCLGTDT